jgi:predicted ATP-grasp superfamily ATP-dependent carboligase
LTLFVRPALRDASLVLSFDGWNDAGAAGSTAIAFLERQLHAVPLGEIECEEMLDFTVTRPSVRITDAGRRVIDWPKISFSFGSADASRELVLGAGPEPHLRWRSCCESVAELARAVGLRRVVLVGAYLADVVYSRPVSVTGFASDPSLLESIDVSVSNYEGPTGIVGVLAEHLAAQGHEVVSLWAGLPHYINASPNPRGALALVQKLVVLLDLKLDVETLAREAAAFEERISSLVASDPELGEYVRALKKREFAQ